MHILKLKNYLIKECKIKINQYKQDNMQYNMLHIQLNNQDINFKQLMKFK